MVIKNFLQSLVRSNSSEENLTLGTLVRVDLLGVGVDVGVGASIGDGVGSVGVVSGWGALAGLDTGVEFGVI